MRRIFYSCLAVLLLCGCSVNVHDENKAAIEANEFVKILYFDHNYQAAFDKLSPGTTITLNNMKRAIDRISEILGELTELQLYSYGPNPIPNAINIYYIGTHQRGKSYHKIILVRQNTGYRVIEMSIANQAYPEHSMLGKFKDNVIIK